MAQYTYQAKNGLHKLVNGTIEADTREAAVSYVMGLGFVPVDIRPAAVAKSPSLKKSLPVAVSARVGQTQVVLFIRQMSDLIGAGVPVLRALSLCAQQARHPYLKEIIVKTRDYVRDGGTLSEALGKSPQVFPRVYSNLIKAGEASGKLAEVLARLSDLAQRTHDTRMQVIFSLVYPGLIMVVGGLVIFGLLTFVVPNLTTIFVDLDQALPLPTVILMTVSGFLGVYWWMLLLSAAAFGLLFMRLTAHGPGRLWFDRMKLRMPVIGGLVHSVEIGRFARSMSTLLGNGVSMLAALEVTAQIMENEIIRRDVAGLIDLVKNGSSLNGALKRSPVFPESVVTMVAVGEESGQIHRGLERMAEFFEQQSLRYVKTITTLIEPLLILILGLVVGFVVLAMIMPLLRMNMMIQ